MAKKQASEFTPIVMHETRSEVTPYDLIDKAVTQGVDVEELDKLMDLQERWEKRKAKQAYLNALSKFQSIVPDLKKNKKVSYEHRDGGGKTEYWYQELSDITKHIREPLGQCGLMYQFEQSEQGDDISVVCILSHIDGHQERGQPLSGKADNSGKKNSIQQKASTITYLKRYTLIGMLGLASADMDNDGQGGKPSEPQALPKMTDGQVKNAISMLLKGDVTLDKIKEHYTITLEQESVFKKTLQSTAKAEKS